MAEKQFCTAEYQRDRRARIKSGEIVVRSARPSHGKMSAFNVLKDCKCAECMAYRAGYRAGWRHSSRSDE